jgi:hypothetical protein
MSSLTILIHFSFSLFHVFSGFLRPRVTRRGEVRNGLLQPLQSITPPQGRYCQDLPLSRFHDDPMAMFNHFMSHIPEGYERPPGEDVTDSESASTTSSSAPDDSSPTPTGAVEMPSPGESNTTEPQQPAPSMDLSASSGAFDDADDDVSPPLVTASPVPATTSVPLPTNEDSTDSGVLQLHPPQNEYASDDDRLLQVDHETVALEPRL